MKVRAHVFVSGKVQGVFFRSKTRSEAKENHVTGWVRNLDDERVEAIFEGEEENVERLVEFCRKGPVGAKVDAVDVIWQPYSGDYAGFEIED
jgi:acylphosphatase